MTVSSELSRKTYVGDAATTSFDTNPMVFFDDTDLTVYVVTTATGAVVATLTLGTHYTVTGGDGTTGTVSTAGGSSPYGAHTAAQTLVVVRSLAITQASDLVNNDASDAEVIEDVIDRLTMISQELNTRLDRSFVLADTDVSGASLTVPTPEAGKLIGWDSLGTSLVNYSATDFNTVLTAAHLDDFITAADMDASVQALFDGTTAETAIAAGDLVLISDVSLSPDDGRKMTVQNLFKLSTKGDILSHDGTIHARKAVGSNGKTLVTDSTQTDGLIWTDYTRLPLNVNPNFLLDQINEGALYTYSATTAVGPDGWTASATGAGVFKLRTLADPDNAALKCLEITCTTADAAIAAGDNYYIKTALEGYDVAGLAAGTASASQITIQFKAKSNSVTGVFGVAVQNSATNRRYIGTITVPDTAENSYSVTLTLDTSGTWLYTTGIGLQVIFTLAAGSTFQGTAGAWAAGAEQTTSAQANFMSANTNILYLKRFHVIPGGVALAYHQQDIRRELARAQRQYAKTFPAGTAVAQSGGVGGALVRFSEAASGFATDWFYPVNMRASPTVTTYNPSAANANWRDVNNAADRVAVVNAQGDASEKKAALQGSTSVATSYNFIHVTASARLS